MKTPIYAYVAILLLGFSLFSCEKDRSNGKHLDFKGQLTNRSACKSNGKSTPKITGIPDSLSCIDYSWDISNDRLTIKHINAGFNCCPDSVYCDVSLSNDTIIIQEIEINPACNCDCLYDITIDIEGVVPKKYLIKLIEPYVYDQNKLFVEIDLTNETTGSYCVTRKQYPWGLNSTRN